MILDAYTTVLFTGYILHTYRLPTCIQPTVELSFHIRSHHSSSLASYCVPSVYTNANKLPLYSAYLPHHVVVSVQVQIQEVFLTSNTF